MLIAPSTSVTLTFDQGLLSKIALHLSSTNKWSLGNIHVVKMVGESFEETHPLFVIVIVMVMYFRESIGATLN